MLVSNRHFLEGQHILLVFRDDNKKSPILGMLSLLHLFLMNFMMLGNRTSRGTLAECVKSRGSLHGQHCTLRPRLRIRSRSYQSPMGRRNPYKLCVVLYFIVWVVLCSVVWDGREECSILRRSFCWRVILVVEDVENALERITQMAQEDKQEELKKLLAAMMSDEHDFRFAFLNTILWLVLNFLFH